MTTVAEVHALFEAQRANRWRVARRAARERVAALERLLGSIVRHRELIARAMWEDFHKPADEVEITEIRPVLVELRHTIRHLRRWMRPRRVGTPLFLTGTRSEVRMEPRGVVLILAPWNYPFNLLVNPITAAVAAGNCAIVRPSEKVPHTSAALGRVIADAFPPEEVALVLGEVDVAEALVRLPFDHVFFTGSAAVGRTVMAAAAEHLAPVTLELGGKSPALLHPSADLAAAAERVAWGKFINAGQTCVAPDYALVPRARLDEFAGAVRAVVERFYGPDEAARRASDDLCRVVDDAAFARLSRLLDETLAAGARLTMGGGRDAATRWLEPTILADVPPDAPAMREEIFGPILPVLGYDGWDDALAFVRDRPKPLALYVFARDDGAVERALRETSSGGTVVNNVVLHLGHPDLPFGGVGESGMGNYHGYHGFRTFSHERAVLRQTGRNWIGLLYPPYSGRTRRLLALAGRIFG